MTVVRPMSSLASDVIFMPSGAADLVVHRGGDPQPRVRVRCTSVAPASSLRNSSLTSGWCSAASTRGSASCLTGSCSLATSSDCTTISAGPSTSTS